MGEIPARYHTDDGAPEDPGPHDELIRAQRQPKPWMGIMEATLFTGWVYDTLQPHAGELKAHSADRVDSEQLADMGPCNWVPECHMMPAP